MTYDIKKAALYFVVLLGIVSLFADITYEGARSITGPYLAMLGANAAIVGTVAGIGELFGYTVRLLSGYAADKTRLYWTITFIGYAINQAAVPLLALAGNWQVASLLIIMERTGKAIRYPARDVMLSYASHQIGRGWAFGLHGALDQIGAILGPILITVILYSSHNYRLGFAVLLIPAIIALSFLSTARFFFPSPRDLEKSTPETEPKKLSKQFWLYVIAVSLVGMGFVDFSLIAYHFQKTASIPQLWIPLLYAIAMGIQGLTSLFVGKLFDIRGIIVSTYVIPFAALAVPLVFLDGFLAALVGMVLWGIGMGGINTAMRAAIASFVATSKRGTAYGILNVCFGVFWFLGSALMGFLYDLSHTYLIIFSLCAQFASIPFFLAAKR